MNESIFLVIEGSEDEDYRGCPYTNFRLEDDDTIGYFTSRESAQAWVDEQQSEGNAAYQKALKNFPAAKKAYETKRKNHETKQREIAERAKEANVPYTRKMFYGAVPLVPNLAHYVPNLAHYVKTEYEIWEIQPHGQDDVQS